jgi:hypothetical protein
VPNYNKARSLGYYVQKLRRQLLRLRNADVREKKKIQNFGTEACTKAGRLLEVREQ